MEYPWAIAWPSNWPAGGQEFSDARKRELHAVFPALPLGRFAIVAQRLQDFARDFNIIERNGCPLS